MNIKFYPAVLSGNVVAPPSKSAAHRCLISAFISKEPCIIHNIAQSEDIKATINCLEALGAEISVSGESLTIKNSAAKSNILNCNESGSTLRFLIPIALSLGGEYKFVGTEKLFSRPLDVYEELARENNFIFKKEKNSLTVSGTLKNGDYKIRGDISSQFITGMIYGLLNLNGKSIIEIIPPFESKPYVDLTIDILKEFSAFVKADDMNIMIDADKPLLRSEITVEGDCSNSAYVEALEVLGGKINIFGLENTHQGDIIYKEYFEKLKNGYAALDVSDYPDLAPILFAYSAFFDGGEFLGTRRLRIKESDRVESMVEELNKFAIETEVFENKVVVKKSKIQKPNKIICSHNDHRIAMAMSVLLLKTGGELEMAEAVRKSFPNYYEIIKILGAKIC